MNEDRAIRSIAVAGAGIIGLSAALAFARALPDLRVTMLETGPDEAALADRLPTAHPGIGRFHALIGLNEIELVRSGIAAHHLGTIFDHWSASGDSWVHAFGSYGKPEGAIPFDNIWVQAHRSGQALAFDRYAMGAALARAGKFVHPADDPRAVQSRFLYGLRLDPHAYRDRLRGLVEGLRARFIKDGIGSVERREDGAVAALQTTMGERVEADLFVDCSGPSGRLIREVDDGFEDWGEWLPFDHVLLTDRAAGDVPATAARISASDEGWSADLSAPGKIMTAHVGRTDGVAVARGRHPRPWQHNVLAVGDAAVTLDPLHGFHLELAHQAIFLALELLPGRDFPRVETDEYNRRADQLTSRVRDFIALHYLRSGRQSGIWGELATLDPPETLGDTLDQYRYRGRLPFYEDEIVTRDSWTAALLGLGVTPRNVDPQAAAINMQQAVPAMKSLATEMERLALSAPSYADYLKRIGR